MLHAARFNEIFQNGLGDYVNQVTTATHCCVILVRFRIPLLIDGEVLAEPVHDLRCATRICMRVYRMHSVVELKLETGSWKLEAGNMEAGSASGVKLNWKLQTRKLHYWATVIMDHVSSCINGFCERSRVITKPSFVDRSTHRACCMSEKGLKHPCSGVMSHYIC